MPLDPTALTSLAREYAKGMTSIRGRRVQRLLTREFAGAECVFVVQLDAAGPAVLGLSASGAAYCCTDGRGKHASIVKWRHGSTEAVEARFDFTPFVERLRAEVPDGVALVVGHSNSVPPILRALGCAEEVSIASDEYDNLFIVVPATSGKATLVRLRY